MRYQKSHKPSRIVVRGPNFLGDCVLARGFFDRLRHRFPDSEIVFLGVPVAAQFAEIGGWFDSVWTLKDKKPTTLVKTARRVRRARFDLAVSLPASFSAAALFFLAGVPWRVGWGEPAARWMYHRGQTWLGPKSAKHKSQLYLQVLDWLESGTAPRTGLEVPGLPVPRLDVVFSRPLPRPKQYFVFAPGASIELRQWPHARRFLELLHARFPTTPILLVGAPKDAPLAEKLIPTGGANVENWIGKTDLLQLVALCHQSKAVIAMDSGVAHVAAQWAAAKTVVVFGPGDPRYVAPLGASVAASVAATVAIVRVDSLPCSPCESATCHGRYGYQACLRTLPPEAVLAEVQKLVQ